jgi:hypothetical protein
MSFELDEFQQMLQRIVSRKVANPSADKQTGYTGYDGDALPLLVAWNDKRLFRLVSPVDVSTPKDLVFNRFDS